MTSGARPRAALCKKMSSPRCRELPCRLRPIRFALVVGALLAAPSVFARHQAAAVSRCLRRSLVFTYAGDLWTARRKAAPLRDSRPAPASKQSARFSPDCSRIAFTGEYGGDDQVYVDRGGRRRAEAADVLSRAGSDAATLGFRQPGLRLDAGRQIDPVPRLARFDEHFATASLHRQRRWRPAGHAADAGRRRRPLFARRRSRSSIRPNTATSAPGIATSAAGRRISTSTTSPQSRPRTSPTIRTPIAIRSGSATASYFLADRGEHLNLYRYDTGSGETKQLTDYKGADARWASGDSKGKIAFEVDGMLHVYDANANQDRALDITVPSDLVRTRAEERSVKDKIEDFALSAKRQARAVHRARRGVQRADQGRHHARSDAYARRARARGAMVAGRQAHRLRLRPEQRRRNLGARRGRQQSASADQ